MILVTCHEYLCLIPVISAAQNSSKMESCKDDASSPQEMTDHGIEAVGDWRMQTSSNSLLAVSCLADGARSEQVAGCMWRKLLK